MIKLTFLDLNTLNWNEVINLVIALGGLLVSLYLLNLNRKLRRNDAIPFLYFNDDLFGEALEYSVTDEFFPFSLKLENFSNAVALNISLEIKPDFDYLVALGLVKENDIDRYQSTHSVELSIIQTDGIEYFIPTETKFEPKIYTSSFFTNKQAINPNGQLVFTARDLFSFNLLLQNITSKLEFDNKVLEEFPVTFTITYQDIDLEFYTVIYNLIITSAGYEAVPVNDRLKKTVFKYQIYKTGDIISDAFDKRKKV